MEVPRKFLHEAAIDWYVPLKRSRGKSGKACPLTDDSIWLCAGGWITARRPTMAFLPVAFAGVHVLIEAAALCVPYATRQVDARIGRAASPGPRRHCVYYLTSG